MPSTYSTRLRLELIATGEKNGTWGDTTNTNLGTLLEEAISGYVAVTHDNSASYSLSTSNGGSDEARNMVLNIGGTLTAARNVVCPTVEKLYVVKNSTSGGYGFTFKTSGGTGVVVPNGRTMLLYCDGTNVEEGLTASSSAFRLFDSSDATKVAAFSLSGLTTGTTRTFTFPDASTTLVGTDATQTLTNKTLGGALAGGGFAITDIAESAIRTSAARVSQVQDGKLNWVDSGGTADAITATYSPAITALVDGQMCCVRASAANATTTPTFAPNGLTARTIVKRGGVALNAGDISGDGHELILRYDLTNTRWELLNPAQSSPASTTEVLTGTATNVLMTPDSNAALWEKGADITAASTISVGEGGYFDVTGNTTITDIDFATDKEGRKAWLKFEGTPTLTHSSTLILPGSASISAEVGDSALFVSEGSDIVRCLSYVRGAQAPLKSIWNYISSTAASSSTSVDFTSLSSYKALRINLDNVVPATNGVRFVVRLSSDGSSYLNSNYRGHMFALSNAAYIDDGDGASTDGYVTGPTYTIGNSATDGGISGQIIIRNFNSAQKTAIFSDTIHGSTSGSFYSFTARIWHTPQTAMQAVRLLFSSGNIASGNIIIEGML